MKSFSSFVALALLTASAAQADGCLTDYWFHHRNHSDKARGVYFLLAMTSQYTNDDVSNLEPQVNESRSDYLSRVKASLRDHSPTVIPGLFAKRFIKYYRDLSEDVPHLSFPEYLKHIRDASQERVFCSGSRAMLRAPTYANFINWQVPEWSLARVHDYLRARIPAVRERDEKLKRVEEEK